MRRKPAVLIGLGLMAIALMGADDCSTSTKDKPDEPAGGGGGGPKKARLGDPITLNGQESGEKMQVTVLRVMDPLPAGEFDQPESGNRFIGIEVKLKNVGSATYDDSPSNGAQLILSGDRRAKSTITSGGDCSSDFGSQTTVSPGTAEVGCLPFEAKQGLRPKRFQFTLASGFGPEAGEWQVQGSTDGGGGETGGGGGTGTESGGDYKSCDANVSVKEETTTCPFAENVFYEYWTRDRASSVSVYSPSTRQTYDTRCTETGAEVLCTTDQGATVRLSEAGLDAYSQDQADRYAATHDVGP